MLHKRCITSVIFLSLLIACCLPVLVRAEWGVPLNYADLDYKVQYGTDYNLVTFPLPVDNYSIKAWNTTKNITQEVYGTDVLKFGQRAEAGDYFNIYVRPVSNFGLDLTNLPAGSKIHLEVRMENLTVDAGYSIGDIYEEYYYMDSAKNWLKTGLEPLDGFTLSGLYSLDYEIEFVSGAVAFVPSLRYENFKSMVTGATYSIEIVSASIETQVATSFWTQFQNQQNGEVLNDIADTMDEMLSGGAEGEILDQKDDSMADSAGAVNEGIGKIENFQSGYMDAAAKEMKNLSKSVNVNLLATPLKFVQKYTNKIVAGVPSAFLLVFTLPMMFGIVMYILGHPVRAPRPDTSGDEVTRQMTTTTEVLQGRHAGQVTVTRTTTTSQEIGRVHKE